jgi:hypothetical protein
MVEYQSCLLPFSTPNPVGMIYLSLNPSPRREGLLTAGKIKAPLKVLGVNSP